MIRPRLLMLTVSFIMNFIGKIICCLVHVTLRRYNHIRYRNEFASGDILFDKGNDTHIWLSIEYEVFNFENDVYLCLCYIHPSNSSRQGIIE